MMWCLGGGGVTLKISIILGSSESHRVLTAEGPIT
jgi:hypothetical protein